MRRAPEVEAVGRQQGGEIPGFKPGGAKLNRKGVGGQSQDRWPPAKPKKDTEGGHEVWEGPSWAILCTKRGSEIKGCLGGIARVRELATLMRLLPNPYEDSSCQ